MENLDKFDPELLDDEEEYEPLAEGDRRAAEKAMQQRDREEGHQDKSLSQSPVPDPSPVKEDQTDSGKTQTTMFSFFKRTSKNDSPSTAVSLSTLKAKAQAQAQVRLVSKTKKEATSRAGSLVWAKLQGYPWWPGLVCTHRGEVERKVQGGMELNIWFLGENSRSWVASSMVRPWEEEVDKSGGDRDEEWRKGVEEAEGAVDLGDEERLALLLPGEEDPADEEEDEPESPEAKVKPPSAKRRRIVVCNSDSDSDEEEKVLDGVKGSKREDSDSEEEEEDYEVEKILDKREEKGITKYLIKWVGYDKEEDNTWEPKDNLGCVDKIKQFDENLTGPSPHCVELPEDVVDKIAELDLELSEGNITQKGYDKKRAKLLTKADVKLNKDEKGEKLSAAAC
eukprot:GFUD01025715.1.p1 GENE.GFUD01025715.1~~GFUD01025715.1.p1  ORF type:complete len:395 (-),score=174.53 GFUD01025715.1:461-1645(-)